MSGTQISAMTPLPTLPASGAVVPIVKAGDPTNYAYDVAAKIADQDGQVSRRPVSVDTLADLQALPISPATSALYAGSPWFFIAGDFSGQIDDTNIVEADGVDPSVGAWVRQQSGGVINSGRSPGIIRSQQQINDEGLSLIKDFGAVNTGSTAGINNSAIPDAIAEICDNGWTLDVPAGAYRFSTSAIGVLPSGVGVNGAGRLAQIAGAGAANATFIFDGDEDDDAIFLTGNAPGVERMLLSGFRVIRPDKAGRAGGTGAGLRLRNFCGFGLYDVLAQRHGVGIQLEGCLVGVIDTCTTQFNDTNILCITAPALISSPNMLQVLRSTINTAADRGVKIVSGSQLSFVDCTFEGMGTNNTNPDTAIAIEVIGLGGAGAVGLSVDRCYFEANRGVSIYLNHALDFNASYAITRSNFNRFADYHTLADVTFDTSSLPGDAVCKTQLILDGSTFTTYGTVVSDPAKPYLTFNLEGYDGLTLHDDKGMFVPIGDKGGIPDEVIRDGQLIPVVFNDEWSFAGAGSTFQGTVKRNILGQITMSGLIVPGASSTADDELMFTLPVGARPKREYEEFVCARQGGTCVVRAYATGSVTIFGASGASFVSLNGVSFEAQ